MKKSSRVMVMVIVFVFGGIFLIGAVKHFFIKRYFLNSKPPAIAVETMLAKQQSWQPALSVIGTIHARQEAALSTEIAGRVNAIHFNDGQFVKKGALLVQLDDRIDQAEWQRCKAASDLAALSYQRYKTLWLRKAVSKAEFDQYLDQKKQTKAMLEKSHLIIDRKAIKAPFSGHVGFRKIDQGEYLAPGTLIAHLYSNPPFQVHFSLPEDQLNALKIAQTFQIHLSESGPNVATGLVESIDVASNSVSHQIDVKGQLHEVKGAGLKSETPLLPGQFVYLTLQTGEPRPVTLVPKTAVTYRSYGRTIYVVTMEKGGVPYVKQRSVVTGGSVGDQVIILKGISVNDRVVISGQLRLYDGAPVHLVSRASFTS